MQTITDIGTFIDSAPGVKGGRPKIAGTGVTVQRIVSWYKLGLSPEEITRKIGHVSLAQVYAGLTHYHANRDEIEADIAVEEAEVDRLEREHYISQRSSG